MPYKFTTSSIIPCSLCDQNSSCFLLIRKMLVTHYFHFKSEKQRYFISPCHYEEKEEQDVKMDFLILPIIRKLLAAQIFKSSFLHIRCLQVLYLKLEKGFRTIFKKYHWKQMPCNWWSRAFQCISPGIVKENERSFPLRLAIDSPKQGSNAVKTPAMPSFTHPE